VSITPSEIQTLFRKELTDYELEGVNNNGPEWGTNILVDVVVEIQNSINSQSHYLITRDVKILRLD